jgi:hypothetical protein
MTRADLLQGKQRNCREALARKRHRDQLKREVMQGEGDSDEVRRQLKRVGQARSATACAGRCRLPGRPAQRPAAAGPSGQLPL